MPEQRFDQLGFFGEVTPFEVLASPKLPRKEAEPVVPVDRSMLRDLWETDDDAES